MEEEWKLLDISGPLTSWAMPEESNKLVYSIGSHLLIWDLDTDHKTHLRCHSYTITSILFSPLSQHFISIDTSLTPLISVWDLETVTQLGIKYLPKKLRKTPLQFIDSCVRENNLYILEVESEGGYRLSRWEWDAHCLEYLDVFTLEAKDKAFKIRIMTPTQFFTAEKTFIKIWDNAERVQLSRRLYFKSELLDADYSEELSAFAILLGNFTFMIVSPTGVMLTTFSQHYSSFYIYSDYLFLGGSSLQVFTLRNYSMVSEVVNSSVKISSIIANGGNLAAIKFENSTVNVVDLESGSVLRIAAYHSTEICSLCWDMQGNFFSSGNENLVYMWKKQEIGWGLEAVEVSKLFISAIALFENTLAVGFSNGLIEIFDENFEKIASNRVCTDKVTDICFSISGVMLAAFSTGVVVVFDSDYAKARAVLQEAWKSEPSFVKICICEVIENKDNLILACTMKNAFAISVHRISKKEYCTPTAFTNITLEQKYQDFQLHISGKYIVVSSDCIYLYEILSSALVGIIDCSGTLISLDPSGLYLATFQALAKGKLKIYEVGTGELVAKMGRIANGKGIKWSCDGKLIAIYGSEGKLEIWEVPESITSNIDKMSDLNDEHIWEHFPIDYESKSVRRKANKKKNLIGNFYSNTAFTDTVVSLVPKQIKEPNADNFKYQSKVIPAYEVPQKEISNDPFIPKISNLYIPNSSQELIDFSLPPSKFSFIHKPQQAKPQPVEDAPISLSVSKKNNSKNHEIPMNLKKISKGYDEPISFSDPRVKSNNKINIRK